MIFVARGKEHRAKWKIEQDPDQSTNLCIQQQQQQQQKVNKVNWLLKKSLISTATVLI